MGAQQSNDSQKPGRAQQSTNYKSSPVANSVSPSAYYKFPYSKTRDVNENSIKQEVAHNISSYTEADCSEESFKEAPGNRSSDNSLVPQTDGPDKSDSDENTACENSSSAELKDEWVYLPYAEAKAKSEKMIQDAIQTPHPSFIHATPVTSILRERVSTEGVFLESVEEEYSLAAEQIVYDIPLDSVGLRVPKSRTSRSKVDPWRKYGAHVKLCEIGGYMTENNKSKGSKNRNFITIKKGSQPPPPPKTKPLATVEEYMTFKNDKGRGSFD